MAIVNGGAWQEHCISPIFKKGNKNCCNIMCWLKSNSPANFSPTSLALNKTRLLFLVCFSLPSFPSSFPTAFPCVFLRLTLVHSVPSLGNVLLLSSDTFCSVLYIQSDSHSLGGLLRPPWLAPVSVLRPLCNLKSSGIREMDRCQSAGHTNCEQGQAVWGPGRTLFCFCLLFRMPGYSSQNEKDEWLHQGRRHQWWFWRWWICILPSPGVTSFVLDRRH